MSAVADQIARAGTAAAAVLADPTSPALDCRPSPRFAATDGAGLRAHLHDHGYAVVASALDAGGVERATDLLWAYLEAEAGWDRRDPGTWETMGSVGDAGTGILFAKGIGHSDASWFVREEPRVRRAFEHVWGDPDLLASFDGANVFRPWHRMVPALAPDEDDDDGELRRLTHGASHVRSSPLPAQQRQPALGWKTKGRTWFHVDQGRCKPGLHAVQGLVSLTAATPATGGLVVVPGSHRQHDRLVQGVRDYSDYVLVPEGDPVLSPPTAPPRLVTCEAGDLVLWDSRTVHCNSAAVVPPTRPGDELLRAVVYVCMTPARRAPPAVLATRRTAYERRMTTGHWPHLFPTGNCHRLPDEGQRFADASPLRKALVVGLELATVADDPSSAAPGAKEEEEEEEEEYCDRTVGAFAASRGATVYAAWCHFLEASALEDAGDAAGAVQAYGAAFRGWPELDSGPGVAEPWAHVPSAVQAQIKQARVLRRLRRLSVGATPSVSVSSAAAPGALAGVAEGADEAAV